MSSQRDIDLVDELRRHSAETQWIEFKRSYEDAETVARLVSGLSNAARLASKECAYLLWGIDDASHLVVGTRFEPLTKKVGNQDFQFWLSRQLQPTPTLEFREVSHPDGRVVLLEVSAPTSAPTAFNSVPYVRIGSATPRLADDPIKYQQLIERMRPYSWESGVALSYVSASDVLQLLDYRAYFSLTSQRLPDSEPAILEKLQADKITTADVGGRWNITNLGAILFAEDLRSFNSSLARKAVRFVRYEGADRTTTVTHRRDEQRGYATSFEELLAYINGLMPQNEHIGQALRQSHPLFPSLSVRELIANALIHQDMTVTGTGPQIELFVDRIEITNPGLPLVDPARMIDLPPRSRNESLASLMRRMGMCEEQGSGLDKVFREVEIFQLPAPLLRPSDVAMQVVLYGPRTFAEMSGEERVRACYFHAVLQFLAGERMRNNTLCARFGIEPRNAAQASKVIAKALSEGWIKVADEDHPRAGYHPIWA